MAKVWESLASKVLTAHKWNMSLFCRGNGSLWNKCQLIKVIIVNRIDCRPIQCVVRSMNICVSFFVCRHSTSWKIALELFKREWFFSHTQFARFWWWSVSGCLFSFYPLHRNVHTQSLNCCFNRVFSSLCVCVCIHFVLSFIQMILLSLGIRSLWLGSHV